MTRTSQVQKSSINSLAKEQSDRNESVMDQRVTLDDNLLSLIKPVQDEFKRGFESILACKRCNARVKLISNYFCKNKSVDSSPVTAADNFWVSRAHVLRTRNLKRQYIKKATQLVFWGATV